MSMMFMLAQVGWALIPTDNYTEKKNKRNTFADCSLEKTKMAPGKRRIASNCQMPTKLIVNRSAPAPLLDDWALMLTKILCRWLRNYEQPE
jgi:hypothetical protein